MLMMSAVVVVVALVVVVEMVVMTLIVEHVQSSMPMHNFVPLLMLLPSLEDHGAVVDSTVEEIAVAMEVDLPSVVVMYQQQ